MKRQQSPEYKNAIKVAKRISITILCCLPVLWLFSYYTRKIINTDFLQIVSFVVIMGLAVLVEEIVARKKEKKKQEQQMFETKKDNWK